jgi:NitT/TauT family transport system permease protein
LFTVVLTAALPSILTGARIGLIIACIVVFLAEMITSTDGLGQMLVRAARNFQTVDMFEPIIAITLLGLLLNAAFNALSARLLVGFADQP